jgi:hypothetical protein
MMGHRRKERSETKRRREGRNQHTVCENGDTEEDQEGEIKREQRETIMEWRERFQ